MGDNHHVHRTRGVQVLVAHRRDRGHRLVTGAVKDNKLAQCACRGLEVRALPVGDQRDTRRLCRIRDIPQHGRGRNPRHIEPRHLAFAHRGRIPKTGLPVAKGQGTRDFHLYPVQISNR